MPIIDCQLRFRQLVDFCTDVREWLNSDPENVVAIHCKGGKGIQISINVRFNRYFHNCFFRISYTDSVTV